MIKSHRKWIADGFSFRYYSDSFLMIMKMGYPTPPTNKSAVKRAGQAISEGIATADDFDLVDQWRASHGYVINNFQIWIKKRIEKQTFNVEFAQRLKRRNTVFDKLGRRNAVGDLLITDVSSMHDFAGCRLIFENLEDLTQFRSYMHSAAVMKNVQHKLRYPPEKYDYIENPKESGYRGIHDVYRHLPRGSERAEIKKPWDNLLVEIQYRTRAQHAWATAVEISDLVDGEKTKFEMDPSKRGRFFAIASELIARNHEHIQKAFLNSSTVDLQKELQSLENELGILQRLAALKTFAVEEKLQKHNVFNITRGPDGDMALEVIPFKLAVDAIAKATQLESSGSSLNAVYVRADKPTQLRSAYRNYFNDPIDFVKIIRREGDVEDRV
jgi:putative GTP pyrophosphokinase